MRSSGLDAHRLVAATVGLVLVIVPAIASFYGEGALDFPVEAVFVAGALGLPLTLIGFAASRSGSEPPVRAYLLAHRALTAALFVAALVFAVRAEPASALLFAGAVIAMALILARGLRPGEGQEHHTESATTVLKD